jgi:hypothetical protein
MHITFLVIPFLEMTISLIAAFMGTITVLRFIALDKFTSAVMFAIPELMAYLLGVVTLHTLSIEIGVSNALGILLVAAIVSIIATWYIPIVLYGVRSLDYSTGLGTCRFSR